MTTHSAIVLGVGVFVTVVFISYLVFKLIDLEDYCKRCDDTISHYKIVEKEYNTMHDELVDFRTKQGALVGEKLELQKELELNHALMAEKMEGLNTLIAEAEEVKKNASVKHVLVKKPEDDVNYWEAISDILDDPDFQWFLNFHKETLVDQISCVDKESKFLLNPEQVSGAIKSHDRMIATIMVYKQKLHAVMMAESERANNDEEESA